MDNNKTYLIILLFSVLLRLFVFSLNEPFSSSYDKNVLVYDAVGYDALAKDIMNGREFGHSSEFGSMIRTPGYPGFIASIYTIFGPMPEFVIIIQIILDSFLAILIIKLGVLLFPGLNFAFAGILWALNPFAIIYSTSFLSDSLFTFMLICSYYFLIRNIHQWSMNNILFSGILLSLSILVRPVGLLFYIISTTVMFVADRNSLRIKIRNIAIYLLILLIFIGPWYLRNKQVHGHFFYSISGEYNSLILYATPVIADNMNISLTKAKEVATNLVKENYGNDSKDAYLHYQNYQKQANDIILENKLTFLKIYFWGIIDMYFSIERNYIKRLLNLDKDNLDVIDNIAKEGIFSTANKLIRTGSWLLTAISFLMLLLFLFEYFFASLGSFFLVKEKKRLEFYLLIIPILYFTLLIGPAGLGRFKLPIIPFYLILLMYSLNHLYKKSQAQRFYL